MERHELEAWLGPALEDLSPEQVGRLHQEAIAIYGWYPDNADVRDAALSAAVQYLLGELTVEEACKRWHAARAEAQRARAQALRLASMAEEDGMSAVELTRVTGLSWWETR